MKEQRQAEYKVIAITPSKVTGGDFRHDELLQALKEGWGVVSVASSQEVIYYVVGRFKQ